MIWDTSGESLHSHFTSLIYTSHYMRIHYGRICTGKWLSFQFQLLENDSVSRLQSNTLSRENLNPYQSPNWTRCASFHNVLWFLNQRALNTTWKTTVREKSQTVALKTHFLCDLLRSMGAKNEIAFEIDTSPQISTKLIVITWQSAECESDCAWKYDNFYLSGYEISKTLLDHISHYVLGGSQYILCAMALDLTFLMAIAFDKMPSTQFYSRWKAQSRLLSAYR